MPCNFVSYNFSKNPIFHIFHISLYLVFYILTNKLVKRVLTMKEVEFSLQYVALPQH